MQSNMSNIYNTFILDSERNESVFFMSVLENSIRRRVPLLQTTPFSGRKLYLVDI